MKRTKKTHLNGSRRSTVSDAPIEQPKAYFELVQQLKKLSPDWHVTRINVESEVYRNHWELRAYSRNLWRENPYIIGYGQELSANVFGPFGYTLRMMCKEEDDRVIYTSEEKAALKAAQRRLNNIAAYVTEKTGKKIKARQIYREVKGKATVEVGDPDVFANQLIERKWAEWQQRENCTVTGRLTYNESRILRMTACARDGDHFIRIVKDGNYKPFGFKIQHINSEWCNYYYSGENRDNKNPIRFGIEYDVTGAAPVPVAYWFIKANALQWQTFSPIAMMSASSSEMVRIPANEIIHYAKFDLDSDISRPVPWATPVMSNVRQLAKWMEAAVVAARVGACSNVFFETDLMGPDGTTAAGADPDIMKKLSLEMNPGGMHGLPPGVRAKEFNPNNPNSSTETFRTEALREICAGLPGAQFSCIGQNYAEINFSAGRLERLNITAQWQMLQEFDINIAEKTIFSEWLKMALITQAVPLPLAKFWKFNQPKFTGRRWEGVDPIKEANAKALNLANKFTSPQRIHDEQGTDMEQTYIEIQEANQVAEMYGITTETTQGPLQPAAEPEPDYGDQKPTKPTK